MKDPRRPVVVTLGEPAGIGPDLSLLAWQNRKVLNLPPFYIRGSAKFLNARSRRLGLNVPIEPCSLEEVSELSSRSLSVVQTGVEVDDTPGKECVRAAETVVASIVGSVDDVSSGHAAAVVTNPINKAALYKTGFSHPGHTEFLGELAKKYWPDSPSKPVMMIAGPDLMVVPLTIHIPISKVPECLTEDLIIETAEIVAHDLKSRFGFPKPRLALCGLNPHAGENRRMGTEDEDTILPAVQRLQQLGIDASGPHPADTLFHPEARRHYDCVYRHVS